MESAIYFNYTGDLLYRYHVIENTYSQSKLWFFAEGSPLGWEPGHYYKALIKRIFVDGPRTILLDPQFGLITLVALIAGIHAIAVRNPAFLFPELWFLSQVVMYNFASTSLQTYTPLVLFFRYLHPILLPAVLCTAGYLDFLLNTPSLAKSTNKRVKLLLFAAFAFSIIIMSLNDLRSNFIYGPQNRLIAETSKIVKPTEVLFADERSINVLKFFWGYPENIQAQDFSEKKVSDIPSKSYVLIEKNWLLFLYKYYQYKPPEFVLNLPENWYVLIQSKDGILCLVP